MERIRILHVIGALGHGGAEQGILKISNGLDPNVFEQTICAGWSLNFLRPRESVRVVSFGRSEANLGFLFCALYRVISREKPHIVHSRNFNTIEAVPAARLAGVPAVIHSEHGRDVVPAEYEPLRRKVMRKICYRMADRVFSVSKGLQEEYVRALKLPETAIDVIYNGVDTQKFSANPERRKALREKLGVREGCLVVGCVARFNAVKDHRTLLRAVDRAIEAGVEIQLVLVGDGPDREAIESEVRSASRLSEHVVFAGRTLEVADWLNCFDVYALPSLFEGISNILLESMAVGLPSVATRVGGNLEVIEDGVSGLLFEPRDSETLAEILQRLAASRELRCQLGANARKRIEQRFNLEQMLQRYDELYRSSIRRDIRN